MDINVKRKTTAKGDLVLIVKVKDTPQFMLKDMSQQIDEETFCKIIKKLKYAIKHSLETKCTLLCQEVYNWIYDAQSGDLRKKLEEYDPQRSRYYFDNDKTIESDWS